MRNSKFISSITHETFRRFISVTSAKYKKFAGKKWALMGVIPKLAPIVDAEVSKAFARFHDEFGKMGCAAFAFVVGGAVAIKAQAQRHHDTSGATKLVVNHFRTEEQALDWLKTMGI